MLAAGTKLGHYTIVGVLGSGGMADVYEAADEMLGRRVALKVLPVEFGRNPQLVQRFEKEVRAAAALNHSGIVTIFEVGHADGLHYYSMRMLTGGDLRSRIDGGLSDVEALSILREAADAFAHAHANGFVHRDVKPENILFDEQGRAVLTDFGIANRMGRGYSYEIIRAKTLYAKHARKVGSLLKPAPATDVSTSGSQNQVEYGPHIPTLVELSDSGELG